VPKARAQARAGSHYPFLIQKERDSETGLDYFLARYYSSTQGQFTSPDEFTGGPDELFTFADDASNNPTFYADLTNPQSLNKYQYAYGNLLRFVDSDGHEPEPDPEPQDPCGCKDIQKTANQIRSEVEKLDEATSKPLLPITDIIGTSTPPTIGPVALPNDPTVAPVPKIQAMPQAPPAPSQAHKKKKQSTGKNKDHPKDRERPGRPQTKDRLSPNWRGRQRPPNWPKGKPWPPWKDPRPKDWPKYEPWPPKPKQPSAPKPTPGS
jgi:RHS repeat-associated protein